MKRFVIIMLALLLVSGTVIGQTPVAPSGDGTEGSPYQIATWQNLYWISQSTERWNKYYIQTADISFPTTGDDAINTWDGGAGWTPIGNSSTYFTGYYDGQNHTISNLYINRSSTDYVGLFGYVERFEGDAVKNLVSHSITSFTVFNLQFTSKTSFTFTPWGEPIFNGIHLAPHRLHPIYGNIIWKSLDQPVI